MTFDSDFASSGTMVPLRVDRPFGASPSRTSLVFAFASSFYFVVSNAAAGEFIYWTIRSTGGAGFGLTVIPTLSVSVVSPSIFIDSLLTSDSTSF